MERVVSGSASQLGRRLLQAGAGAGKTTTLISTFFEFVEDFRKREGDLPRIVITTFTRKATQEVKERLLRKALESGQPELFRFLGQRSRVHISTIHGVLAIFLARYGDRIGLSPDFKIADGEELKWLGRRELRRVLAGESEFVGLLEDHSFSELFAALEEWRENQVIHPAAKFASTDEFRRSTMSLIKALSDEAHHLAGEIPGQSKNAGWLEWAEILKGLPSIPQDDAGIDAFLDHLTVIDEEKSWPRLAAGRNKLIDPALGEHFNQAIRSIWKELVDPEKGPRFRPSYWQRHEERCALFEKLARVYSERIAKMLLEKNLISMADLELRSLDVIRADSSAAKSFSLEWDYWMIDEYQDTSPVQVELLEALVGGRPHFVVGDPQQSIYAFRGARSEVFFEKKKRFEESGAHVSRVGANHRSRAPLLEFFNDFFVGNSAFQPMEPKSLRAANPDVPAADFRILASEPDRDVCVHAVIERVQELLTEGASPESICVLGRRNSDLKSILNEARRRQLPVQLHTAGGFSERREIADAAAFVRFLLNPADNLNFLILLRSPWFRMKDEDLAVLCEARPVSYWAESQKSDHPESHPLRRLSMWLQESGRRGLSSTLREFFRREGILDSAALADPSGRREANLWKFLLQLESAQRRPGFNGLAFLKDFHVGLSTEEGGEDGDAVPSVEPRRVNLMTVHASKGLEFDHVILTHMHTTRVSERTELFQADEESGVWTLAETSLSGQKVGSILSRRLVERANLRASEENARLLYVALTRAMQTVTLVWEDKRAEDARTWSSLVPFATDEGLHRTDKFLYRVRRAPPTPSLGVTEEVGTVSLRPKWIVEERPTTKTVSATQLLEAALMSDIPIEASAKSGDAVTDGLRVAQRGTDAHRLFEALKYASVDEVRALTTDAAFRKAIDWLKDHRDPPILRLIENGQAEWGFAAAGENFVLQGQIDLWAEVDGRVWIVDYKTGSSRHAEKALDQMAIYAWALTRLKCLKADQPVSLLAVYPLEEKTEARVFAKAEELGPDWKRLLPS